MKDYPVLKLLSPHCVIAEYSKQNIKRFQGNELIEALGTTPDDSTIIAGLVRHCDWSEEQLLAPPYERFEHIQDLLHFFLPQERHIRLYRHIFSMIREGYIGRAPGSAALFTIRARIANSDLPSSDAQATQISRALLGHSGAGKSTAIHRIIGTYPQVIFHPKINEYQIPCLVVEISVTADSFKDLMKLILAAIDKLIPNSTLLPDLGEKGKPTAGDLLFRVAAQLSACNVGILIVDEINKLQASGEGFNELINKVLTLCNISRVPLLFSGTNAAGKLLVGDGAVGRRSIGLPNWNYLVPTGAGYCEFTELAKYLHKHVWLKNKPEFTSYFSSQLFFLTQGVQDFLIKLYLYSQEEALFQEIEELTLDLMVETYKSRFGNAKAPLAALRAGDVRTLFSKYPDFAPLNVSDLKNQLAHRMSAASAGTFTHDAKSDGAELLIATALAAVGIPENEALKKAREAVSAKRTESEGPLIDTLQAALKSTKKKSNEALAEQTYEDNPRDYRRSRYLARKSGTSVIDEMLASGQIQPMLDYMKI